MNSYTYFIPQPQSILRMFMHIRGILSGGDYVLDSASSVTMCRTSRNATFNTPCELLGGYQDKKPEGDIQTLEGLTDFVENCMAPGPDFNPIRYRSVRNVGP